MHYYKNSDYFQKLGRFSFHVIGYFFMAGLAVILVLAWVLTEPLFQSVKQNAHRAKL
jgi:hypothetical protein